MAFVEHSIIWIKGEAFEMTVVGLSGLLLLVMAGLLWRFAPTAMGQALPIPLTVVASIFIVAGLVGIVGMPEKLNEVQHAYQQSPSQFVYDEKVRVGRFEATYTYTIIGAAACFATALVLFAFWKTPTMRAMAVALMIIGLAAMIIDMFSEERAQAYEQAIDKEIMRIQG